MGSRSDPNVCFEGHLAKKSGHSTQKLWCTLDGQSLAFYRSKRSSCMFTIEVNRIKSVKTILDKKQFELLTEKNLLFATETSEICEEWVKHIEEAREQGGQFVLTGYKIDDKPSSIEQGSLPQQNAVSNAIKRLSNKSENFAPETSDKKCPSDNLTRTSSTKDMINRFSTGKVTSVTSPTLSSQPNLRGNVNNLMLRFSGEIQNNLSPTSPVSPTRSPSGPFSPKSPECPTSSEKFPTEQHSSHFPEQLVSVIPVHQENMPGITTATSVTKVNLSDASSVVAPSHNNNKTVIAVMRNESGGDRDYAPGTCVNGNGQARELQENLDTLESAGAVDDEVVIRPRKLSINGDVVPGITLQRVDTEEEEELDGPDLQLLDQLMNLTFEEVEIPETSSVDLTAVTDLKGLLTDLPTSLLLRRSVDLNDQTSIEQLRQFLNTAH